MQFKAEPSVHIQSPALAQGVMYLMRSGTKIRNTNSITSNVGTAPNLDACLCHPARVPDRLFGVHGVRDVRCGGSRLRARIIWVASRRERVIIVSSYGILGVEH